MNHGIKVDSGVNDLSQRAYKEIRKPSNLQEAEGVCPLCDTVMQRSKSAPSGGHFYSFDFPVYLCLNHYHGYFRWLGGSKGHVRILFPQISKYGKIVSDNERDKDPEMITLECPDCGFEWEELEMPFRNETYCPECSMRIEVHQ
jgi:DNA-directed RNA polymerase subunit RPC12/RpoP